MSASYPIVQLQIPQAWPGSPKAQRFFEYLRSAPSSILMLDYDGTLAPFQEDRLSTRFYEGVRKRIERLIHSTGTRVVLISGRKAMELRSLVALTKPVEIWGSHGREHLAIDGTYTVKPLTAFEQNALRWMIHRLEDEFSEELLECKVNSVAAHWRGTPSARNAIESAMQRGYADVAAAQADEGAVELLPFDGGIELRAGSGNKGDAVKSLLSGAEEGLACAFLGDDVTDEDGFSVLRGYGSELTRVPVLVRSEPRPSHACIWLRPPTELLGFLDAWIEATGHES